MKKIIGFALMAILCATIAFAGVRERTYNITNSGIGTNAASYSIHGMLEAVYIDVAAGVTSRVVVSSSQGALLTVATISTDTMYYPLVPAKGATGTQLTINGGGTNALSPVYVNQAMSGPVTVTVTDLVASETNDYAVTVIWSDN